MKRLLGAVALLTAMSSHATPQLPDVVQLVGPYEITTEQARKSVVNLYLPTSGIGLVSLFGGDTFTEYHENINGLSLKLSKEKNTIYIQNGLKPGQLTTIGLTSACGTSVSIKVHSVAAGPEQGNSEAIKPKLAISGASCQTAAN